jgi:hypothetical protein
VIVENHLPLCQASIAQRVCAEFWARRARFRRRVHRRPPIPWLCRSAANGIRWKPYEWESNQRPPLVLTSCWGRIASGAWTVVFFVLVVPSPSLHFTQTLNSRHTTPSFHFILPLFLDPPLCADFTCVSYPTIDFKTHSFTSRVAIVIIRQMSRPEASPPHTRQPQRP